MAEDGGGPWGRNAPDPPSPPRRVPFHRLAIWLGLMAALAAGVALLAKAFPGQSRDDWPWIIWSAAFLVMFSTRLLTPDPIRWGQKARHVGLWLGIAAVLVVGLTYRDELAGVGRRVRMELTSSYPVATGDHELVVSEGDDGGFHVMGQVNGQPVRFLVDTGASETVLSPADARRLGVAVEGLSFDQVAETANGAGYGARLTVDSLAVGTIAFTDVPVLVNKAPMSSSLLGLSFLQRLESFQVRGRRLYMKARE